MKYEFMEKARRGVFPGQNSVPRNSRFLEQKKVNFLQPKGLGRLWMNNELVSAKVEHRGVHGIDHSIHKSVLGRHKAQVLRFDLVPHIGAVLQYKLNFRQE